MRDPSGGGTAEQQLSERNEREPRHAAARAAETTSPRLGEAHYRAIFDSARDFAIFTTDLDGVITSWNPGAEKLLGWSEAEAVGEHACMIFTPADHALGACQNEMRTADERGRAEDERWHRRKDGTHFWASGLMMRFEDEHSGQQIGYLKVLRDRTPQHEATQRLGASESRYRQMVEGAEDFAIVALDDHGVITSWNSGAERITGYSELEAIGQPSAIIFTPEDRAAGAPDHELNRASDTGRVPNERWHLKKDGTRFWGSGLTMRLDQVGGGYLKIFRDRTAEHVAEGRRQRRSDQLQRLAEIAMAVARAPSLEATLEEITHAARRIIGAHQGVVSLTRGADWSQAINSVAMTGKYDPWRNYAAATDGTGIYAWVCEENRPVRFTQAELEAHPRWRAFGEHAKDHPPMRGWLAAPLVGHDGRNLGLIQLSDKEDGGEFDEDDEAMLVQLAQLASAAVEQAHTEAQLRASEEFNRRVLASSADCIKVLDLDGRLEFMSEGGMCVMEVDDFGAIDGACWPSFWAGEEHARAIGAVEEAKRGGTGRFQGFATTFKGSPRWWDVAVTPISGQDGKPEKLLAVSRDITATKQAEEALHETSRRLDAILNNTREAVFLMDEHQQCVYANAAAELLTGYRFAEMQDRALHDVVHHKKPDGSHYPLEECPIDRAFPERAQMSGEELFVAPDGSFYPVAFTASPVLNDKGQPIGTVIEARNIAEEKARDAALRESEARFRLMADAVPQIVWITDAAGRVEFFNKQWSDYTGVAYEPTTASEVAANHVHPDDTAMTMAAFEEAQRTGTTYCVEHRIRSRSGEYRWFLVRGEPHRDPTSGKVVRWFGASVDIHDRRRAEQELQQLNINLEQRVDEALAERKLWADVFESTDALISAMSLDRRFLALNNAYAHEFERIFAVRPKVGDSLAELLAHMPEHRQAALAIWDRALAGESFTVEEEFGDADRARPYYELRFNPLHDKDGKMIGAFQYALDVTQRLRSQAELADAQEQLRQAQKMEAVGQLTGGIAHDFNNLLTGVIGSLDMMQRRIAKGETDKIERYTTTAMTAANRAAALTHRLLAFSRRQPLDPKPVSANRLVTGMEELLRRTIGEAVRLEIVTAGGLWQTLCDPNQLESAILNLAINARDAMGSGGSLTIETCNAHLDNAYAAKSREVRPGQYICICVTDTGAGMTPDVIAKAFDPFFTTKPIGQGTGLGLSMIYGFARQSEGYAKIYSEVGKGTTVKLYLPRYYGEGEDAEEASPGLSEEHRAEHGEVVLVVEDETAVRELVVDVLEELGYRAVQASDGPSGFKLLQSDMRVDLLVTDVGLPGMNGRQLADHAREHRPGLKVLFMTGYAENATIANGFLEPGMQMITKPFAIDALATRIRDIIEDR